MRKILISGMLLISAAFLFTSCSQKQDEGKVPFIDREVDVLSFLEGFPYSTWGFYLSDDASKLIYVRNTDGNPLLLLDLAESTDISRGKVISNENWAERNFWSPEVNENDGCLYWMGDQANDEKIDLYRLNPATGETTCFTDVPYIYGWSFNDDKTLAGYVARISQTENDHVDEFHVLNVVTGEDKLICTDKADFRMTWTEVSFSPDNSGAMLTVLKNVNRTHTNMAYLDFASGEYKVVTNPALEASLSGCAVISLDNGARAVKRRERHSAAADAGERAVAEHRRVNRDCLAVGIERRISVNSHSKLVACGDECYIVSCSLQCAAREINSIRCRAFDSKVTRFKCSVISYVNRRCTGRTPE